MGVWRMALKSLNKPSQALKSPYLPPVTSQRTSKTPFLPPVTSQRTSSIRGYQSTLRPPINWGIRVVSEQKALVVERFGKYHKTLLPGIHFLIPGVDRITYYHCLKEKVLPITDQNAITLDDVRILVQGLLFIQISNPYDASYAVDNIMFAVTQLAHVKVCGELGKISMEDAFKNREKLSTDIVVAINEVAKDWGLRIRFEIRDIIPPSGMGEALDMQAEATKKKHAYLIEALGWKEAQAVYLKGEADGMLYFAAKKKLMILEILSAVKEMTGDEAVKLRLSERYIDEGSKAAKLLLPNSTSNRSSKLGLELRFFAIKVLQSVLSLLSMVWNLDFLGASRRIDSRC